jgi:hypothetical protein
MCYSYRLPQLRRLAEVYMQATGIPATTLGERISPTNNRLILRLLAGENIFASNAALATDWFLDNWLPKIAWPEDVPRRPRVVTQVNGGAE